MTIIQPDESRVNFLLIAESGYLTEASEENGKTLQDYHEKDTNTDSNGAASGRKPIF